VLPLGDFSHQVFMYYIFYYRIILLFLKEQIVHTVWKIKKIFKLVFRLGVLLFYCVFLAIHLDFLTELISTILRLNLHVYFLKVSNILALILVDIRVSFHLEKPHSLGEFCRIFMDNSRILFVLYLRCHLQTLPAGSDLGVEILWQ